MHVLNGFTLTQEGVGAALLADGGGGTVAGEDSGFIRQGQQTGVNGVDDLAELPPGRSVRPMLPAKSVSPAMSSLSGAKWRQTEPCVWPGVCSTWAE